MTRRADDLTREWPQNIEAEKSVIGALLIENSCYDQISRQLDSAAFYREAHRKIYAAAVHLLEVAQTLDLISLKEELDRRGELEDVGGPAYVASLVDGVPRSTNVRYYAQIVREKAAQRALMRIGGKLVDAAANGQKESRDVIREYSGHLESLASQYHAATGTVSIADSMSEMNARLAKRIEHRGQLAGASSGLPKIDLYTHGWQRRKMYVVAAQTSFGKSVFAFQSAIAIASAGERVIYYSLEMSRQDLIERGWSMLSGVPLENIIWGNIQTKGEFAAIAAAQEQLAALPLEINDSPSTTVADMRSECRQVKADRGLGSVILDYFQRMDIPQGDNRAQKLGEISRQLQTMFSELDVSGFVLSQLTLDGADAAKEPQLEHLRDCKSLGHDADAVIMLHPYNVAKARTDEPVVPMKALFRKQRGGHLGMVTLNLERDYVRFVEAEPPEAPAREPREPKAKRMPLKW